MKSVYVDASAILRVVLDEPNQLAEWEALEHPVTSVLAEVEGLRTIDRAARTATSARSTRCILLARWRGRTARPSPR